MKHRLAFIVIALSLLQAFSLPASAIDINVSNFPDENFRNYLLAQDYGTDGVLTEEEIEGITSITVNKKKISSLNGIEYFTALASLSCDNNQLTALDVSKNTALTSLYCYNNQLSALDVSKNTALKSLYCYNNQLTILDVSKNTALTVLSCDDNQLTALDVSKNTGLITLSCCNNQLTALDVSKNTALRSLSCFNNQLTALDVSKNTALTIIYCDRNNIKGEAMTALINSLPNNNSSKDYYFRAIYKPTAETNILTKSQAAAVKAKSWIPQYYDSGWKEYEGSDDEGGEEPTPVEININVTNFPDENFRNYLLEQNYGMDGVLTEEEIKGITSLSVDSKGISSLKGIEYFTSLTKLTCYNNQLTALDVSKNTALDYLYCENNQLTALDVSKNTALRNFGCSVNQLTALDVSKNTALTGLDCSYNQLTVLDVSKNTALINLHCNKNQLTALDVSKNTALNYLYCDYNQLAALDVSKNTALTILYCDYNQLTALDVSKNTALSSLDCYRNNIKGEAMTALINSLPNNNSSKDHYFRAIFYPTGETNILTKSQAAAVKAKGWIPQYYDSGWKEYEGSDDTPDEDEPTDMSTFTFKAGDYAWNTTQMFKITSDNLVTNGDFANGLDGWYGADRDTSPSADVWSITEGAGPNGEKVIESLAATGNMPLCNSWTLEAGTYVVSYNLKYTSAGYTTILTAGSAAGSNAIDFFLNGDGNFTKLASSDKAPVVNVAYQTNFAAEEWNTIVYYFSAEQGQQLVMHAEKLATGMQITNLEIHAATQVYDRRIAQNRIAFVKQLMEMPEFNVEAAQDAKANLQGIIETIEGMIESGEIDDQSNAEALMQGLEEEGVQPFMSISSRLMNDKLAGTVDLPSLAEVKRGGNLPAAFANLSLQGGNWGHPANQNYMMSAIQTGFDHTATYNVFNTNFPKGRYLFTAEIRNANTDKTSWPCNPTYNAETVCKVFVGTDSIETAPIAGETFQRVTHVADIAEDGAFRAGIYWPGVGKGGAFFIQNVEVYALGDGQAIENQTEHIKAWNTFKSRWDATTSARTEMIAKINDNNYPWGQDSLLSVMTLWEPIYQNIVTLGWVAPDGSDAGVATTEELSEWAVHQGYYTDDVDDPYYERAAERGFMYANTYVTNVNKPIADLKAAIAEHTEYRDNPHNSSGDKALYTPAIAAAQAVLDDICANSTDAKREADEARITEQTAALEAALEAFTASVTLKPFIDIDFSNPAEEGEEVAYFVNGAKGQMTFAAFELDNTVDNQSFTIGRGEECPGVLRVGNGSGVVAFDEADMPTENDIIEAQFDIWFGNLSGKNCFVDLRNADDQRIAGFSQNSHNSTLAYNEFNDVLTAGGTGMDLLSKRSSLGSSIVADAGICVDSNRSSFTLIIDLKAQTVQGTMTNKNGKFKGAALPFSTNLEDNKVAKFVIGSNYNSAPFRRCWFDNLKIYKYPSNATDYILGDVNGNGGVDIGDAVSIVNYLVGKESTNFVEKAADTNKNGQIDIGDAVTIVNFLVGKTESLSRTIGVEQNEREPQ